MNRIVLLLVLANIANATDKNTAWKPLAPSPVTRVEGPAAVANNKLYIFGGFTAGFVALTETDVYDPASDTWKRLHDFPSPVTHLIPAVDGNTIWFAGGFVGNNPGKATDQVWKYDIAADAWTNGPALPEPRAGGALAIAGSSLHYFGGFKADRNTDCPEHWTLNLDDPKTWERAPDMPDPRGHLSTAVVNGKIYALGGQHGHDKKAVDIATCHVFDTATGNWKAIANLPTPRSHFEPGTLVHDGHILIIGGRNNTLNGPKIAINTITQYDPATDTWTDIATLPENLAAPACALIGAQLIVTCGGLDDVNKPQSTTRSRRWGE